MMKKGSKYLANIVDMKKESLNNDSRQKQALKAVQRDRQLRVEQEEKDEVTMQANRGNAILDD